MLVCQEDLGLESLLAQYVTPEVIDNAHCPGCAKKRSASKDSSRPAIKRTLTIGKVISGDGAALTTHRTLFLLPGAKFVLKYFVSHPPSICFNSVSACMTLRRPFQSP